MRSEEFWRAYVSLAVLLLGGLALVMPSGYSVGAVMLLLGSAVLLVKRPALGLTRRDWLVMGAMAGYAAIVMLEAWWAGLGVRGMDKPLRILLAVPALLLVMAYPPRLAWLWSGLALGAVLAGGMAGWQSLVQGVPRVEAFTHPIQFGNISMLMGMLCLAGLGWAVAQPRRRLWVALLLLGALGGVLGSLFSGSRGGWIGVPVILIVLYRSYGRELNYALKLAVLAALIGGATVAYAVPQIGVQQRVHQAVDDISRYVSGESRVTSVGSRFEMWRGASRLALDAPWLGVGSGHYEQAMRSLADQGVIDPGVLVYDHAHNEFLDTLARRGLLGLAVLLALYLVPMKLFARQLHAPDMERRALASAGVILPVAYIDFGLTQVFLSHNSGVMIYGFWLAVLWGSFKVKAAEVGAARR
nr:O-antigen ligase family protein [Halomonas campisalis]